MSQTPTIARIPAEWEKHDCCWMTFPYLKNEWGEELEAAQKEHAGLVKTIATIGEENVRLLVANAAIEEHARKLIGPQASVEYIRADYGDCWTRDTAPTFGVDTSGQLVALRFRFNGWGNKYPMPGDADVGALIAARAGTEIVSSDLFLEGGGVEFNGVGTCVITESCVLNKERNQISHATAEQKLLQELHCDRIVWLRDGLLNDHTDGHVDTLARFVSDTHIVCTRSEADDPNHKIHAEIATALGDTNLDVSYLPSPGEIKNGGGELLPASYANFYIANQAVIAPQYGSENDAAAIDALKAFFPSREIVGMPSKSILSGGGAVHCVTQQQPKVS